MLHIHCGDVSANQLRQSGVAGDVIVWSDILEQGPTPADLSPDQWRTVRAEFLCEATGGALQREALMQHLTEQDEALKKFRNYGEVVLWFDACMYDQAILIRQLAWFARQHLDDTKLSLICVGEFPDFEHFKGLGELSPEQLASLIDLRHEASAAEIKMAVRAWNAWCSPHPGGIQELVGQRITSLPYLQDALLRHLEQFPSCFNGLNRIQRETLEVIAAGHSKLPDIFIEVSAREERPFFGDTSLWRCIHELSTADTPILDVQGGQPLPLWEPPGDLSPWTVFVTEVGQKVLDGSEDWIKLNGVDQWVGGVHLGPDNLWRWNAVEGQVKRSDK